MNDTSDIGENVAIVCTVGLALGFTAWLFKQGFDFAREALAMPVVHSASESVSIVRQELTITRQSE